MRYRLQRHDGTDCSATMVPITVLRMVPIQRYRHNFFVRYTSNKKNQYKKIQKFHVNHFGGFYQFHFLFLA